ncbi:MAG: hypothetical protein WB471_10560 [Nocardioides sp.]
MTPLLAAQASLDEGAWQAALDSLSTLVSASPEALELRATALYGLGDFDNTVATWEQLHQLRSAEGDQQQAARAAVMVAMFLLIDSGLMSPIRGWLSRARVHLDGLAEGPTHALVEAISAYERFFCGDLDAAAVAADRAGRLAATHDVPPAMAISKTLHARLLVLDGQVEAGLSALDDVGTLLMSGEIDNLTVGMMLCEIICAAQSLSMPELAREWTDVMEHWRHGAAIGGINGRCRVHRAELLRLSGPCDAAEAEALAACEALRPWMRREFGWPLVELGTIRLRKGDLDGAEEAFLAADALAWSPQPGLALLRLARGDVPSATAMIADAVAHPPELPWKERPPSGDLRMTAFLDAQSEIALAARDAKTAAAAADHLSAIATQFASRGLAAAAELAQARAQLLAGKPQEARAMARAATAAWAELGAPYESAVARVVEGDAASAQHNRPAAEAAWQAAHRAFVDFGALGRADEAHARLDGFTLPAPAPSSRATFHKDGSTRLIEFAGSTATVPDLLGMRYLEELLTSPGLDIAAIDLVDREHGSPGPYQRGIPVLDDEAKQCYRRRLAEVDEDIAEAEDLNDLARADLSRRDRDYLIAELGRAVGLGGRDRLIGSDAERARTSVFRAITYAAKKIEQSNPLLADHLRRAVSTGTWCRYTPDPLAPVEWRLSKVQQ